MKCEANCDVDRTQKNPPFDLNQVGSIVLPAFHRLGIATLMYYKFCYLGDSKISLHPLLHEKSFHIEKVFFEKFSQPWQHQMN